MAKKYTKEDKSNTLSEEQRAIDTVCDFKDESVLYYADKFKSFNYFDSLYIRGSAKMNVPYGRANLRLPLAFQQVEPFVSQMSEAMAGEAPYIRYSARKLEDEPKAESMTDFTQYQMDTGGFIVSFNQWLRNISKYGTAVMKVVWDTDTVEIENEQIQEKLEMDPATGLPVMDPLTGMPKVTQEVVKTSDVIKKHDGPCFYNLSIFDFFVPKSANGVDIQKLSECAHRTWRTPEEIYNNPNYKLGKSKIAKFLKDKQLADGSYEGEGPKTGLDRSKIIELEQKNAKGLEKYSGKWEVLEWWGDYKVSPKDTETKPYLITVATCDGTKILLRCESNPLKFKFKPFVAANRYPIEGEFYGYGDLHHISGLIDESTALRNARLDTANMSLNRAWLVERTAEVNQRDLYFIPNKVIYTNDNNAIRALDPPQVNPSTVNELAKIDFDIQNTTDVINARQDVSSVGGAFSQTATGVNFMSSKGNLRMLTTARLLEETFFKPLANILNWYNKDLLADETDQFQDGDAIEYFSYWNEENPYKSIQPSVLLTDVDFRPTSNPQKLNLAQRKDNLNYMLQVVAQGEKVAPGTFNLQELFKEAFKVSGFSHPEKFLKPPVTQVLQLPNGQVVDQYGKPVQVVPVGPDGKPIPPEGAPPAM